MSIDHEKINQRMPSHRTRQPSARPKPIPEPVYETPAEEPAIEEVAAEPSYEEAQAEAFTAVPEVETYFDVSQTATDYDVPLAEPAIEDAAEEPSYEAASAEPVIEEAVAEPAYEEAQAEDFTVEPEAEPSYEVPETPAYYEEAQAETVTEEPAAEPAYAEPETETSFDTMQTESVYDALQAESVTEEPAAEPSYEVPETPAYYEEAQAETVTEEPAAEPSYEVPETPANFEVPRAETPYAEPETDSVIEEPVAKPVYADSFVDPAAKPAGEDPGKKELELLLNLNRDTKEKAPDSSLFGTGASAQKEETDSAQEAEALLRKAPSVPVRKKRTLKETSRLMFIVTAALFLIIIFLFIVVINSNKNASDKTPFMEQIREQEIKENDVKEIDEFFKKYYGALSSGNTTEMEAMFDDPSKAHITTEVSSIVDGYDIRKIYVTQGIEESDVVAFVETDLHFANIKETAPSVDSYYLQYNDEDKSLKICADMYTDQEILRFMNLVAYREPIRSFLEENDKELTKVLKNNKDLNNLYTLMKSMADESWDQQTGEESEN